MQAGDLDVDTAYMVMYNDNLGKMVVIGSLNGGGTNTSSDNYLILNTTLAGTTPVDIVDTRITDITPFMVYPISQPAGVITPTLTNGQLELVSSDAGDTMDVYVVFWNI